jgi:methylated-DNA-[protein]-cysteine S-methyltransferase
VDLLTDEIESALGTLVIVARDGRLAGLDYADCGGRMIDALAARYGRTRLTPASNPFGFSRRIRDYLAGDLGAVDDVPVATGGTPFHREVWTALRRIPAGTTVTYAEMARKMGRPAAPRAVGAANARNPIAIVIPCHRLIGSDGSLTGYAGGLLRKRWLLAHEGALSARPRLPGRGPAPLPLGPLPE